MTDIKETTRSIQSCLDSIHSQPKIDQDDKRALLDACDRLKAALESPIDVLMRIMLGAFAATALRVCKDMGIFQELASAKETSLTANELSQRVKADPLLIVRFMRIITATGLAKEVAEETYAPLPILDLLKNDSPVQGAIQHMVPSLETVTKLPEYFETHGYTNPNDAAAGPWQHAHNTSQHFFDWTSARPKQQAAFNSVMRLSARNRGQEWFDFFPVPKKLQASDASRPLLVDVGGGTGQNVAALVSKYPELAGRLVLQDLPGVIDAVKEPIDGVHLVKHDFFDPQPVKGAKAYYLRTVLHDWPDSKSLEILKNTRDAMDSDSLLLINEQALPGTGVSRFAAETDITMMAQFASLERTERQWRSLLDAAGFEVKRVWVPTEKSSGDRALFEAKIKGA